VFFNTHLPGFCALFAWYTLSSKQLGREIRDQEIEIRVYVERERETMRGRGDRVGGGSDSGRLW
jgi:hypothetical protein